MKREELYNIVLKAINEIDPKKSTRGCGNCLSWKIQKELEKTNINCDYYYNGTSCSNPLFYLEDLGIIEILQGVPGAEYDNLNRRYGVECGRLKIKLLSNPDGNKI